MTRVEPSTPAKDQAAANTEPDRVNGSAGNPFPGPQAYRSTDREYFFGRTEETEELTSLVLSSSATLLYAQSGAGKSSLLQAGVAPYLESRFKFVILPTVRLGAADQRTPTDDADPTDEETPTVPANPFVQVVCDSIAAADKPIHDDIAAAAKTRRTDESQRALLVLDQFEEVFNHGSGENRQQFFRHLTDALEKNTWLRAIIALRSDYLAALVPYERHLPANLIVRYQLEGMVEEQVAEAIAGTFSRSGMDLGESNLQVVLDALFQRASDSAEPAAVPLQYANTIQLQIVCRGLWEVLHATYGTGPVPDGALTGESFDLRRSMAQFVDEAIRRVVQRGGAGEPAVRWWLENELITTQGRRAFVSSDAEATAGLPNSVVGALEEVRLVQLEQRRQGLRLAELTHDSMIDGVRTSNETWRHKVYRRRRRVGFALLGVLIVLLAAFWPLRADQPGIVAGPVAGVLGDSPKLAFSGQSGQAVIVRGSVAAHQHTVAVEVAEGQPPTGGQVVATQTIGTGPYSIISLPVQTVPGRSYVARLVREGDASVSFTMDVSSRPIMAADAPILQLGQNDAGVGVELDPASGAGQTGPGQVLITVDGRSLRAVAGVPKPVLNRAESWVVVPRPAVSGIAMLEFDPPLSGAAERPISVHQVAVGAPDLIGMGGSARLGVDPLRLVSIDAGGVGQAGVELKCEGGSVVRAGFAGEVPFSPKNVEQAGTVLPLNVSGGPTELVLYSKAPARCAVSVQPYRTERIASFGRRDLEVPAGRQAAAFPIALPDDAALVLDVPGQLRSTVNCGSTSQEPTGSLHRRMTVVRTGLSCELWLIRSDAATDPLHARIWVAELNDTAGG